MAQALLSGGMPKPGARMLIQGGAGGVGHFAIQLAKAHFKAHVVATGGPSNQALMMVPPCTWSLPRHAGTACKNSAMMVSGCSFAAHLTPRMKGNIIILHIVQRLSAGHRSGSHMNERHALFIGYLMDA